MLLEMLVPISITWTYKDNWTSCEGCKLYPTQPNFLRLNSLPELSHIAKPSLPPTDSKKIKQLHTYILLLILEQRKGQKKKCAKKEVTHRSSFLEVEILTAWHTPQPAGAF
jgi:hypothetical protein